jgi:hypothetical protein
MLGFRKKPADDRPRQSQPGRPNSAVFSYYAGDRAGQIAGTQPQARQTTLTERKPYLRLRYIPSFLAGTAILVSLFYLFVLDTNPHIVIIPDNSAGYHDVQDYAKGAQAILGGSVLNRTKITINTNGFKQKFLNEYPEVSDINIALPVMGRRPTVTLELSPPAGVLNSGTSSFVLDGNGRAVLPLNQARSSILEGLPVITDESTLPIEQGKVMITKEDLQFIADLSAEFKAKDTPVQSMTLAPLPNELHVRFTGVDYYVKFDITGNARDEAGTYLAVRDHLKAANITPVEYIDVRVPEKAFYK